MGFWVKKSIFFIALKCNEKVLKNNEKALLSHYVFLSVLDERAL